MQPHKLPRQEDVTEVYIDDSHTIAIAKITPENKDALMEMTLSMYLGEQCKYCLRIFDTLDDIKTAVYAGYHEHGRLACKKCWDENNGAENGN